MHHSKRFFVYFIEGIVDDFIELDDQFDSNYVLVKVNSNQCTSLKSVVKLILQSIPKLEVEFGSDSEEEAEEDSTIGSRKPRSRPTIKAIADYFSKSKKTLVVLFQDIGNIDECLIKDFLHCTK